MKRALASLLVVLALLLSGGGALAHSASPSGARVVASSSWIEEWDPASGRWVRIDESVQTPPAAAPATLAAAVSTTVTRDGALIVTETVRALEPARDRAASPALARFGPFRVIDPARAALVGPTDAASPRDFAAMRAAFPQLAVLEFVDAPGTSHDLANLALGRAIRAAGLATHVPAGGSARSGAVELFLAGTRRSFDPGARFAVHSWRDEAGREPADFAPDAPENRLYLDYYAEMGMSAPQASAFYAMTNSVPHAGALWLEGAQMARWLAPASAAQPVMAPQLERGLRRALARSGAALAGALARRPAGTAGLVLPAPRIAQADAGAALLDSVPAFP